MSKIFISHSSKDKARFVRSLAKRLSMLGHETWFDEWSIKPGESLSQKIQNGIFDCDYFLVVVSEHSIHSPWVQRELNDAMMLEIERGITTVIPIIFGTIDNSDIPLTLRAKRFIDFRTTRGGPSAKAFRELINAITSSKNSRTDIPTFICPACTVEELKQENDNFHLPTIELVCLENNVSTGFRYDNIKGEIELFFEIDGRTSRPIRIQLAEPHFKKLGAKANPDLWRIFVRGEDQNGILKLQFKKGKVKLLFLYWINYAIERYIESQVRELTNDWDFEVTLGKQLKKAQG